MDVHSLYHPDLAKMLIGSEDVTPKPERLRKDLSTSGSSRIQPPSIPALCGLMPSKPLALRTVAQVNPVPSAPSLISFCATAPSARTSIKYCLASSTGALTLHAASIGGHRLISAHGDGNILPFNVRRPYHGALGAGQGRIGDTIGEPMTGLPRFVFKGRNKRLPLSSGSAVTISRPGVIYKGNAANNATVCISARGLRQVGVGYDCNVSPCRHLTKWLQHRTQLRVLMAVHPA